MSEQVWALGYLQNKPYVLMFIFSLLMIQVVQIFCGIRISIEWKNMSLCFSFYLTVWHVSGAVSWQVQVSIASIRIHLVYSWICLVLLCPLQTPWVYIMRYKVMLIINEVIKDSFHVRIWTALPRFFSSLMLSYNCIWTWSDNVDEWKSSFFFFIPGVIAASRPKLQTFWAYAKVELRPPAPSEIPQIKREIQNLLVAAKQQRWKQLTVQVRFLLLMKIFSYIKFCWHITWLASRPSLKFLFSFIGLFWLHSDSCEASRFHISEGSNWKHNFRR